MTKKVMRKISHLLSKDIFLKMNFFYKIQHIKPKSLSTGRSMSICTETPMREVGGYCHFQTLVNCNLGSLAQI